MMETTTRYLDPVDDARRIIREGRIILGLSQEQFAEKYGFTQTIVTNFESGASYAPRELKEFLRIAHDFSMTVLPPSDGYSIAESHPPMVAREQPPPDPAKYIKKDIQCPECDTFVPGYKQGAMYCVLCGHQLGIECPKCSWVNDRDNLHCVSCGHPLSELGATITIAEDALKKPDAAKSREQDRQRAQKYRDKRKSGEPEM